MVKQELDGTSITAIRIPFLVSENILLYYSVRLFDSHEVIFCLKASPVTWMSGMGV